MKRIEPFKLIASLAVSFAAAAIGSLATTPNIPTWYAGLEKPFFNPPNWLFGPVWSVLYLMVGIALYLVWASPRRNRPAFWWFGAQMVLNAAWSLVFFGLHSPEGGIVVILALLIAIIGTMVRFWKIRRPATLLFVPYLLWVSFATCLTIAIAVLN